MSGGEARKHHWVPQCYLKGFTTDRNKSSQLYVVDGRARKSFRAPPSKVAAERDFNRIEVNGHHPNSIESAFSGFETRVSDALDRIEATGNISNEEDRVLILNLIAMLAVRNPRMRETMRGAKERQAEIIMDILLSSKERWCATVKRATADGYVEIDSDRDSYEEMRDFVAKGDYEIGVPTTEHVITELKLFDEILPYLIARKWTVFVASTDSGGFITCDHPVVLKWDGTQELEPRSPPGFALRGTEVVFPLSRRLALSGVFDGDEQACVVPAEMVVAINGMVIVNAGRQIYASDEEFGYFLNRQQGTRMGGSLVADLVSLAPLGSERDTPSPAS